jgi:hypothetical protein
VSKLSRGPGKKLRKWEIAEIGNAWYARKRGQKIDVVRNAQHMADTCLRRQIVHAHGAEQTCKGVRWPDRNGDELFIKDGWCAVIEPRTTAPGTNARAWALES